MNILITGHKGFIGRNLVEAFKGDSKYNVYGADLKTSQDINFMDVHGKNMPHIDRVYHLAATSDIRDSFTNPDQMFKNNVTGTYALLNWMRKTDVKEIVFASSSSVYGKARMMPTPEIMSTNPISHYAASKVAGESFIRSFCHLYGMKGLIFRFANVVGPHLAGGAIYDITRKLEKDPYNLEVLGDGKQRKSYMYVGDCADALTTTPMLKEVETYNLSSQDNISVDDLVQVICDYMHVQPTQISYTGGDGGWPGDVPITNMDITKALSTGWVPIWNSKQTIVRTLSMRSSWKDVSTEE